MTLKLDFAQVESVIDTIIDEARTGEIGDGKIFGNQLFLSSCLHAFFQSPFLNEPSFTEAQPFTGHGLTLVPDLSPQDSLFFCLSGLALFCDMLVPVSPVADIIRVRTGTLSQPHRTFS